MGGTRRGAQLTQREAAEALGVSVEAIRKRVKRGTLRSEKGEDGRRYVYLDDAPDAAGTSTAQDEGSAMTVELRDRLRYVEKQLEAERQAHAEARRLLAAALERIPPAIEPPREPSGARESRESPEMAGDEQQGRGPVPDAGGPQEGTERPEGAREGVPWWRRIFGE
jgi:hypothetical protein